MAVEMTLGSGADNNSQVGISGSKNDVKLTWIRETGFQGYTGSKGTRREKGPEAQEKSRSVYQVANGASAGWSRDGSMRVCKYKDPRENLQDR